jgi:hypothetical protein
MIQQRTVYGFKHSQLVINKPYCTSICDQGRIKERASQTALPGANL